MSCIYVCFLSNFQPENDPARRRLSSHLVNQINIMFSGLIGNINQSTRDTTRSSMESRPRVVCRKHVPVRNNIPMLRQDNIMRIQENVPGMGVGIIGEKSSELRTVKRGLPVGKYEWKRSWGVRDYFIILKALYIINQPIRLEKKKLLTSKTYLTSQMTGLCACYSLRRNSFLIDNKA